jgi:hypothetical protein
MKKLILASVLGAAAISTGCSDSSSGSSSSSVALTGDAALPEQMSLVTAQDDDARSTAMWASSNISSRAIADTSALAADSDYSTSRQNTYVHLDAVQPISFIDSLLCFTNQSQPLAMVGEGDYVSWNDASRCFEEKGDSGDSQGDDGNQVTQYVTFAANSSQASANDPLIFKAWVEDYAGQSGEGHGPTGIKILGEVNKTPTDDNPFGVFSLTYGLLPDIAGVEADNEGFGEVKSSETTGGGASFTLFQEDKRMESQTLVTCNTTASVDYNEATETGLARTGNNCDVDPYNENGAFALAVNSDFVHMAMASDYDAIDQGSYDTQVCLARDSYTNVAWSYSLFNKADGSEVELNSGMQLKAGSSLDVWAHIGYWGAWREDGQAFTDGETVQEATYDDSVGDSFTVKVSKGRLIKNTMSSVNLADLDGVRFATWLSEGDSYLFNTLPDVNADTDTNDFFEVILEKNSTDNGFDVVATKEWTQNGDGNYEETITPVSPIVALDLNTNVSLNIWSRQLGGDVRYVAGSDKIRLFERSFVNGGETGTGELFATGAAQTLKCFDRCLDVNVTAAEATNSSQDAVYVSGDGSLAQDYSFNQADLTLKVATDSVIFDSAVTANDLQGSNFWQWGLQSGPMVTSTSGINSAADLYTAIEAGTVTEFYVWETGLEPWQQQIRLLDSSNAVVAFDKPITIRYTHETANDRNAPATGDVAQNGDIFLLEYGGKGQLWGLPFVQNGDRWNPVISLKDGVILGSSNQYIVKARDVEQKMAAAPAGSCDALPLTAPSQAIPTGITGEVFDIGTMPDISDLPPSLIDGEAVE